MKLENGSWVSEKFPPGSNYYASDYRGTPDWLPPGPTDEQWRRFCEGVRFGERLGLIR